jgi:addiction module HigA family antidote
MERSFTMRRFNPPHPGRIIKDALPEIPMTVTQFAAHIGVSRVTLSRVINERAAIRRVGRQSVPS